MMKGPSSAPETLVELCDAYANGLNPAEIVRRCFQRIDAARALNAFTHEDRAGAEQAAAESAARWRAGRPRSPLDGIPVALKANIAVAGMPWTNGLGALGKRIAVADAEVVRRMRAAGMIIIGCLNMHEAALGATTNNPHFGATHNPRQHGFTPGGSSGGSGAAVAAGLVPIALGTDTMGSVRIPAAYCGCVGLLPSRGQVSRAGVTALSETLDQVGILARTVDDASRLLAVLAGHDPNDMQSLPGAGYEPPATLTRTFDEPAPRLALYDGGEGCDPSIRAELRALGQRLTKAGWQIRNLDSLPADGGSLRRAGLLISEREGYAANLPWLSQPGVSDELRAMLAYGARQPAARITEAHARLQEGHQRWQAAMSDVNAWLLPTAPQRAFPLNSEVPPNQADLTVHANAAALAAISLPLEHGKDDMPCGAQLLMQAGNEAQLIRLAAAIALHAGAPNA